MTRTSRQRLDRLRRSLSDRDLSILGSLQTWRLMRINHIEAWHFAGHASAETASRVARRVLRRLTEHGLIGRLERCIGGIRAGSSGFVYALTPLGHRLLGESARKRWHEPGAAFVDHTLAVSEIGSLAVRATLDAGGEVLAADPEPDAWRSFVGPAGSVTLKPDLFLRLAGGEVERSWFIEIDRSTESRTVLTVKNQTYTSYWRSGIEQAEHGVFPRVLWVAPDLQRAEQIASTFHRSGIEPRLFLATTTDQAIDLIVPPAIPDRGRVIHLPKEDQQHNNTSTEPRRLS